MASASLIPRLGWNRFPKDLTMKLIYLNATQGEPDVTPTLTQTERPIEANGPFPRRGSTRREAGCPLSAVTQSDKIAPSATKSLTPMQDLSDSREGSNRTHNLISQPLYPARVGHWSARVFLFLSGQPSAFCHSAGEINELFTFRSSSANRSPLKSRRPLGKEARDRLISSPMRRTKQEQGGSWLVAQMKLNYARHSASKPFPRGRSAFTLIELLVTITIIGILVSILIPSITVARAAARSAACGSNLRQFGVGFFAHAERNNGQLCSGAFDWRRDGAVTEIGWVADLVNDGIPVGEMLCVANEAQLSATYKDLLKLTVKTDDNGECVDWTGSAPRSLPDGTKLPNPCWAISSMNKGAGRQAIVARDIYLQGYNTNYAASWLLVRTQPRLDGSGNLFAEPEACANDILSRNSSFGPLSQKVLEASSVSSSFVPLLGCARTSSTLNDLVEVFDDASTPVVDESQFSWIGPNGPGSFLAQPFTSGPKIRSTFATPSFSAGTNREGANGWWKVWDGADENGIPNTMQDYRGFNPIHRGVCNVLMGDGSVKKLTDRNRDGGLNNGFLSSQQSGFSDSTPEISPNEVFSKASLRGL